MSDEIEDFAGAASPSGVNPHLLAYDFFKHMTNLSLLTLGGMVTLFGSIFSGASFKEDMLLPVALIAASGAAAFLGQLEILQWAYRGGASPKRAAIWYRWLTPAFFGTGIGAFLATAQDLLQ
jgi:hypothetical protein